MAGLVLVQTASCLDLVAEAVSRAREVFPLTGLITRLLHVVHPALVRPALTRELSYQDCETRVMSGHICSSQKRNDEQRIFELWWNSVFFRTIRGRRSMWKREIRDELSPIQYYRH